MSFSLSAERTAPWVLIAVPLALGSAAATAAAAGWPLVVTLVVMPILEEVVFRAGLQDGLLRRRVPAPWANAMTAVVFTCAHLLLVGVSLQTALVIAPAFAIGLAFTRWRRLGPCIALHILMNGVWNAARNIQ